MKKRDFTKLILLGVSAGMMSVSQYAVADEDAKDKSENFIVSRDDDDESSSALSCGEKDDQESSAAIAALEKDETSPTLLAASCGSSCSGRAGKRRPDNVSVNEDAYPQYSDSQRNANQQYNQQGNQNTQYQQYNEDQNTQNGKGHGCAAGGCNGKPSSRNGSQRLA